MRGLTSSDNNEASIGIGALIIFIAMVLVAGVTASVMLQVMNSMQQQALSTGQDTIREVSSGLKVTHISGYSDGSSITQLAIFLSTSAGSNDIDLTYTKISLSESTEQVILDYSSNLFSGSVSGGIFSTLNAGNMSSTTFGVIVIRDIDSSCISSSPVINRDDLVVLIVNATDCFLGIGARTDIEGTIVPEYGINGLIRFTTPSVYIDDIIELQP